MDSETDRLQEELGGNVNRFRNGPKTVMHGDLISVENYENKNVTLLFGFIDLLTFKTWTFFAEEKSHNSVYVHNNKLQV